MRVRKIWKFCKLQYKGVVLSLSKYQPYTAITRARKLCVLAGSPRAISMAVRNNKVAQRFMALEWRLAEK